uniref:Uncharacterized protein n=1 Tax=Schistosoma haematobium TaxID=6185 RepID=A0A095AP27_SCHHA
MNIYIKLIIKLDGKRGVRVCEISLKDLNYDWLTVRKVVKVNSLSYDMERDSSLIRTRNECEVKETALSLIMKFQLVSTS